jgi:bifunctional UDP-N-acetylglucosamine pyrophosphorylase/glucosamine-1-phosphate N-acetyltransferase
MKIASVVLAAGQGVRMKTQLPKVLHPLVGKPMVLYVLDTMRALECEPTILVIGHGAAQVRATLSNLPMPHLQFVEQREQLGTGHAVLQARAALQGKADAVLVCYADMPLVRAETLQQLVQRHAATDATITMLTLIADDSMAFGRIVRDAEQRVVGIVEERDATPEQLAIRELNGGIYCFDAEWLWEHLTQLQPNVRNGEYYLTDLVELAARTSRRIEAIVSRDANEMLGINTRVQLAQAERLMRERINTARMLAGVTLD